MNAPLLDPESTSERPVKTWHVMIELSTYSGPKSLSGRREAEDRADVLTLHIILEKLQAQTSADFSQAMEQLLLKGKDHSLKVPEDSLRHLMMIAHCLHVGGYEVVAYEFASSTEEPGGLSHFQLIPDPLESTGNN
jgi:ferritin-like metal-binding protein YciE